MSYAQITTSAEVWAVIHARHSNDLSVFESFSDPDGRFNGEVYAADDGRLLGRCKASEYCGFKWTKIILTIAHMDHVPEHVDDSNLKALCQRCHLVYDAEHHAANARETRRARKAVGDLFAEA